MAEILVKSSTSSSHSPTISVKASANVGSVTVNTDPAGQRNQPSDDMIEAIFSYIQTVRSLGRTTINTAEIERALKLPKSTVRNAIALLAARGVQVIK